MSHSTGTKEYGRTRETDGALIIESTREEVLDKAALLYKQGYTTVVSLSAIDYPEEKEMEVVVAVTGYGLEKDAPRIAEIRIRLPREDPWMPSLTSVWASAEFQEREAHEMFGIIFKGHPDLRYLLLDPRDYRGIYPLRKDFVVKEEPIMAQLKRSASSSNGREG